MGPSVMVRGACLAVASRTHGRGTTCRLPERPSWRRSWPNLAMSRGVRSSPAPPFTCPWVTGSHTARSMPRGPRSFSSA